MRLPSSILLALLLQQSVLAARPAKRHYDTHDYYVLEHDPSGDASLDECTGALGVELVEQAGELKNHYLVRTTKPLLAARHSEDRVLRAYQDIQRRAQSSSHAARGVASHSRRVASSLRYLSRQELRQRTKRAPPPIRPPPEVNSPTAQQVAEKLLITDPEFTQQWHLVNDEYPSNMMNVSGVWEKGITGKGVISTLVDDGLDYNSDDLALNFVRDRLISGLFGVTKHIRSMRRARMIITIMRTSLRRSCSTITTALAAPAK